MICINGLSADMLPLSLSHSLTFFSLIPSLFSLTFPHFFSFPHTFFSRLIFSFFFNILASKCQLRKNVIYFHCIFLLLFLSLFLSFSSLFSLSSFLSFLILMKIFISLISTLSIIMEEPGNQAVMVVSFRQRERGKRGRGGRERERGKRRRERERKKYIWSTFIRFRWFHHLLFFRANRVFFFLLIFRFCLLHFFLFFSTSLSFSLFLSLEKFLTRNLHEDQQHVSSICSLFVFCSKLSSSFLSFFLSRSLSFFLSFSRSEEIFLSWKISTSHPLHE